jgi:hypothetical protein
MATSDIKKGPLYVDSTNNRVGIGTASPSEVLEVYGTTPIIQINDRGLYQAQIGLIGNDTEFRGSSGNIEFYTGSADGASSTERFRINASGHITQTGYTAYGTSAIGYIGDASNLFSGSASDFAVRGTSNVTFGIGASEKMRITSAGDVLIGTQTKETTGTTLYGSGANGFYVKTTSTCGYLITQAGVGGAGAFISLYSDNAAVGSITTNGSSTTYGTSSDYRLKENVTADWNATTRLKQLNPVRFNFISDADTTVDGFLAHEVQDVVPEAITGTKDAVDDEGNPAYQGIDQSKLVPLLVKTIQELEARITALEAN